MSTLDVEASSLVTTPKKTVNLSELKTKAFIPAKLPEDFLRIHLNEQQICETQDSLIAQRLQYGNRQQMTPRRNQTWRVPPRGRLEVTFFEARLAKNYGMLGISRMDPYIRLNIGGKIFETHTDSNGGKNPKWNKTVVCYLPQEADSLLLEIYDEKAFMADEQIAYLHYKFPEELFQSGIIDEWFPLTGRMGEHKEGHMHLRLQFIPIQQIQQNTQQQQHIPQQPQQQQSVNPAAMNRTARPNYYEQLPPNIQSPASDGSESSNESQPQAYTEEDVKAIREMFPTFDEDIIRSVLETNNGHKENTINILLQMITD